ncbi:hypothetical protein KKG41_05130 [Patescibacteria group bacterium]|nr:hypothetical protein [Patescibacteria group bacterium]MBU1890292.1 hypothetical protein [Patescibacteria group bacterium]
MLVRALSSFPSLFPLVFLHNHPHKITERLSADNEQLGFVATRFDECVVLSASTVHPEDWSIVRIIDESSPRDIIHQSNNSISLGHGVIRCAAKQVGAWKNRLRAISTFSGSVNLGEGGNNTIDLCWGNMVERALSPEDRNEWVLHHWKSVFEHIQWLFVYKERGAIRDFVTNKVRSICTGLERIGQVIPRCTSRAQAFLAQNNVTRDDLQGLQRLLIDELPTTLRERVLTPTDPPNRYFLNDHPNRLLVEHLTVSCRVDLTTTGVVSAEIQVMTKSDTSKRSSHGFRFLKDLLGAVPSVARQNTARQEIVNTLNPSRLPTLEAEAFVQGSGVFRPLLVYTDCYHHFSTSLDTLLKEFEQWPDREADVIQA